MRRRSWYFVVLAILSIASVAMLRARQVKTSMPTPNGAAVPTVSIQSYGSLPLAFEVNQGQTDSRVKFVSRGSGYTLFLTGTEAVLSLRQGSPTKGSKPQARPHQIPVDNSSASRPSQPAVLRLKMVGASPTSRVVGISELPGMSNYFLGNDPKKWRTNVINYAKVRYTDVYPGVDLVYYGKQGKLEYDFVVSPGADPSIIKLALNGADQLRLGQDGNLVVQVGSGTVTLHKPTIYQLLPTSSGRMSEPQAVNRKVVVDGRFILTAENRVAFQVGTYDRSRPLVIDPVLVYSSFLGGTSDEGGASIAVDSKGNAYVTGNTQSTDFPTTRGAFQRSFSGEPQCGDPLGPCTDAFITKINASGTAIVYSTYLGGNGADAPTGIAVDGSGNAYVTGHTRSANFPVTRGAFQSAYSGFSAPCNQYFPCGDGFVTKINFSGSTLVYSTYLGGSENESPAGIAVDAARNAYVTGATDSPNFPTTAGSFKATFEYVSCGTGPGGRERACSDGFVTKLNPYGTRLIYSTYLGGSSDDSSFAIAVDRFGNANVTGSTISSDFPVTEGAYQPQLNPGTCPWGGSPCFDAFVTRLNAAGTKLIYSTFLGGAGWDEGRSVAVNPSGNIYVAGQTPSPDFPVTPGAFQTTFGGGICNNWYSIYCSDVFVAKFNPYQSGPASLVYSTFIGGDKEENPWSPGPPIAVDQWGNAHIGGFTWSANFPIVNPLQATSFNAPTDVDAYLVKLNASGTAAIYSTYLGGNSWDSIDGLALDAAGNLYITGVANSVDFPVTAGAFQKTFAIGGTQGLDAIVAKISPSNAPSAIPYPKELQFGDVQVNTWSSPQTITLRNVGSGTLKVVLIGTTNPLAFHQSNNCSQGVLGTGSCTISVFFAPKAAGQIKAYLAIFDNALDNPQFVPLYGNGV